MSGQEYESEPKSASDIDRSAGKKTLEELLDEVEQRVASDASEGDRATVMAPSDTPSSDMANFIGASPAILQLMGMVPQLLNAAKSAENGEKKADDAETGKPRGSDQEAQALLRALRPYLGARRRELTDRLLRFWNMQAILRTIKFK